MDTERIRQLMMAAIDDEISESENRELDAALASEPALRMEMRRMADLQKQISGIVLKDPADDVLSELDTGVYVNQLWYTNYSDRAAGRITGMTRFATFWVEGGQIVAPLNVMRFDESIYRMFGENLLALTAERDFIPDSETYEARTTSSMRLPGALIDNFRFTL